MGLKIRLTSQPEIQADDFFLSRGELPQPLGDLSQIQRYVFLLIRSLRSCGPETAQVSHVLWGTAAPVSATWTACLMKSRGERQQLAEYQAAFRVLSDSLVRS
jgi:hypothetical protein